MSKKDRDRLFHHVAGVGGAPAADDERELLTAALYLLIDVSENNAAKGTSFSINISRSSYKRLEAAFDKVRPDTRARAREIEREAKSR